MYIINTKRQIERIQELVTLRKDMDTFEVYYHDPATGELWKSFFPKGYQRDGATKLLRPEPLPKNLELQLELCLNSNDDTDAIGFGIECSVKPEIWKELLDILDRHRNEYIRTHLNTFIKHLGVLQPDKTLKEIDLNPEKAGLSEADLKAIKKKARWIRLKRLFRL